MMNCRSLRIALLLGAPASLLVVTAPAVASDNQESGLPDTASDEQVQSGGLQDIVVTAQRREESLQKVPIAVTAVTSEGLAAAGIVRTDDLVKVVPGLVNNRQQRGNTPYIRGVGTQDTSAGNEAAVATYVDGIYIMDVLNTSFSFNNIERVEVLKGPQGTLFGRNATGGLINIVTKDPQFDPAMNGSIAYERFGLIDGSFYATGGSGNVAADISFSIKRQADGWGRNLDNGDEVNKRNETQIRSKIMWTPSDTDKFVLTGDWSSNKSDIGAARNALPGVVLEGGFPSKGSIYDTRGDISGRTLGSYSAGVSLRYVRDLGWGSITALSSYRSSNFHIIYDQDLVAGLFARHFEYTQHQHQLQNEIFLSGKSDSFNWTMGLFIFNSYADYDPVIQRSGTVAGRNFSLVTKSNLDSYAAYGQGTYSLTPSTRVTVGGRYTIDKRDFVGTLAAAQGNTLPVGTVLVSGKKDDTFKKPSWRLAIDQDVTNGVMAYASYNRGFKSGVYNLAVPNDPVVLPETIDAFEAGIKSDLFDRTLRFNVGAFLYDYKNIQLVRNENGLLKLLNAAKGRSKGLEFETVVAPRFDFAKVQLRGALSLLDAKYTSFPNGPTTVPNPAGGNLTVIRDLSGNEMIASPDWTFTLAADASVPTSFGSVGGSVSSFSSAAYSFEADGRLRQKPYTTVNAQLFVAFGEDERFRVRLYARNLTNRRYVAYSQSLVVGDIGTGAEPRIFGGAVDFRF